MTDQEFKTKLIYELHEINLSLRELSGRNVTSSVDGTKVKKTYTERYFTRSTPKLTPKEDE